MNSLRVFLLALLHCLSINCAAQDLLDSFGHLARWIPVYGYELRVSAAFGRSDLPYVVYNPMLLDQFPSEYIIFLVLRQDHVAAIVSTDSSERKRRSLRDISGTQPIEEESIYDNPKLGSFQARALDCLAYRVLIPAARRKLVQYVREANRQSEKAVPIWPTNRFLLPFDFAFLYSSVCMLFAERFTLKKE